MLLLIGSLRPAQRIQNLTNFRAVDDYEHDQLRPHHRHYLQYVSQAEPAVHFIKQSSEVIALQPKLPLAPETQFLRFIGHVVDKEDRQQRQGHTFCDRRRSRERIYHPFAQESQLIPATWT